MRRFLAFVSLVCLFPVVYDPDPAHADVFLRGDANADALVDISDPVFVLLELFSQPGGLPCEDAADSNDDGSLDLGDVAFLLAYLFRDGAAPPSPGAQTPGFDGTPTDAYTCGDAPAGGGDGSSFDRIRDALAGGTLDEEAALLYSVWASFADERLPAELRGDDEPPESPAIGDVIERFDSLSLETRVAIAPFLEPPSAPGSWLELREGDGGGGSIRWSTISTVGDRVKVWWQQRFPTDEAIATVIADEMERRIWPRLVREIMGPEPLRDASEANNGGDGALDIYLCSLGVGGLCIPYRRRCAQSPAFILLNAGSFDPRFRSKAAHEFMHALQYTYDLGPHCLVGEYRWLAEATANWAEDAVYPKDNREQTQAIDYLKDVRHPLESTPSSSLHRPYGAYLFPFFVTKATGNERLVRGMWEGAASAADSLAAVDGAIPGGFEKQWPDFAVSAWNHAPFDDLNQWDDLVVAPPPGEPTDVGLEGGADRVVPLEKLELEHLSIRYFHFRFSDPAVRRISFYNGFTFELSQETVLELEGLTTFVARPVDAESVRGAKLTALVRIAGQDWREEAWTDKPIVAYCRDRSDERLEELVLIFTNSRFEDRGERIGPPGVSPGFVLSDIGCWRWSGEIRMTAVEDGVTSLFHAKDLRFDRQPQDPSPGGGAGGGLEFGAVFAFAEEYRLMAGTIDVSVSGTDSGGCGWSASRSGLQPGYDIFGFNYMHVFFPILSGPYRRGANVSGFLNQVFSPLAYTVTIRCPDDSFQDTFWVPFFSDIPEEGLVPTIFVSEADGSRITSRVIVPESSVGHLTIDYDLRSEREGQPP